MKKVGGIFLALLISLAFPTAIGSKGECHSIGMAVEFNDHAACAYVAMERGWYEDEGVNFTAYDSYVTGMRLASAIARGDIQVAYMCLAPAVLAYSRGVPIKIVAGTHKYGYGLVVSPGIMSVSDLEGKTIGCVREGAPVDLLLHRLTEEYDLKNVRVRRMNPLEQVIALETGRIDGAFLPEHHATVAECKGFHMLIESQNLWPDMPGSVLMVKTDLIEEDPETVRKMVRVTQKATNWINENPDDAARILARKLDTQLSVIRKSMQRLDYTTDIDARSVQEMIDYMAKLGYIQKGITAQDMLDTRFLYER